jgi:hypothetical protein
LDKGEGEKGNGIATRARALPAQKKKTHSYVSHVSHWSARSMCIFSSRSLLVGGHHIEAQGLDTLAFMQRPQLVTLGSENFSQLAPEQRCAALNAPVLLDQPPMPPSSCQPIPRRSLPAHSGSSEVRSQPPGEGQARPELGRQVLLLGSRAPRNTESLPMLAICSVHRRCHPATRSV